MRTLDITKIVLDHTGIHKRYILSTTFDIKHIGRNSVPKRSLSR